jgi:hypothetical protein
MGTFFVLSPIENRRGVEWRGWGNVRPERTEGETGEVQTTSVEGKTKRKREKNKQKGK